MPMSFVCSYRKFFFCIYTKTNQLPSPMMIGYWKGSIPIPDQSFEDRITQVQGEDKELLFGLVRSVLCWLLEKRPTAEELAYDDFLMQAYFAAQSKG